MSETPPAAPARPKPSGWRWPRRVVALLLSIIVLLPLAAYLVLATEVGSGWLLHRISAAAPSQGIRFAFARSRGALLDDIELGDVVLEVAQARVEVGTLHLRWRPQDLLQHLLHVERLALADVRVEPPPPSPPQPYTPPELPALTLPVRVQVDRLELDRVVVQQPDGDVALTHASAAAALDGDGVRLDDLELMALDARVNGRIGMGATAPHALQATLDAALPASLTGADVGDTTLQLAIAGPALRPTFTLIVSTPTALRVEGGVEFDRSQPGFDLNAKWPALQWPVRGEAQVQAGAGTLSVAGTADAYRLALRAPVTLPGRPRLDVALDGHGDTGGLSLQPLRVGIRDGEVRAEGRVGWRAGVDWRLQLQAERIDPGLFAAEWPGALQGRVAVDGRLPADGPAVVDALIESLSGTLRGYPVSAQGRLGWRDGGLLTEGLKLASGPNRVHVDGRAGERLDLAFDVDAPDLASLYPGLAGRISGQGSLAGSPQQPTVVADLKGGDVTYAGMRAATLALQLDWRGEAGSGELQVTGIEQGETRIGALTAALDGQIAAHTLRLTADGPGVRLALAAAGGVDAARTRWRGSLQRLDANIDELGEWRLREPVAVDVGADASRIERLCLVQDATSLCARAGWSTASGIDADGEISGFDLGQLARRIPGDAEIEGTLAARFAVKGPPQRPSASFELKPSDGRVRVTEGLEPFELAYRNARLQGTFADDRGSAELALEIGTNGRADGKVTLGAQRDGRRALGGRVTAAFPDLALVAGFVPALHAVKGRLALALDLGGSLARPTIDGELAIRDAAASVPAAGIDLRDVNLRVHGDGRGPLKVDGALTSGEGRLALIGDVDPAAPGGMAVDVRIKGEDFQAVRLPEATALVSPDLRLAGKGPYRLTGTLRVPRAKIELKELPKGTVAVSDDEVIVGRDGTQAAEKRRSPVAADLRIELGDAVSFKGFGLVTRLGGSLHVNSGAAGTSVDGKIEMRDASYKAYGQDLTVERGRLLFAGPPGNPDVDLRAVRVSRDGDVRAYLAMSGPLAKPRPRVYAEPSMPEAEAVAYLLTGRGLDAAGKGEGADIASAALSLGLSRGEPLLQDLSDRLGLDDLRVESGSNGLEDSSLLLGKYLNPDLYVGYSQGLFSPEGAVLLRLRLSRRFELESRSGNEQSVDLFYKIERD
ncbi:MAG: translocation/assembly module TamB domain-containing protein [Gammaproteobacteria bacterium]|nr:translocation/assembly module TamB domain-containing protein [Gammaproteobacteria bacterium]